MSTHEEENPMKGEDEAWMMNIVAYSWAKNGMPSRARSVVIDVHGGA
jgi:hypothetical protein